MSKYEAKCLWCHWYGSYDNSEYCGNKKRLKELDINNSFFMPKFDGDGCTYFWDENEYYKIWSLLDDLKKIGKIAGRVRIKLLGITGGKF